MKAIEKIAPEHKIAEMVANYAKACGGIPSHPTAFARAILAALNPWVLFAERKPEPDRAGSGKCRQYLVKYELQGSIRYGVSYFTDIRGGDWTARFRNVIEWMEIDS